MYITDLAIRIGNLFHDTRSVFKGNVFSFADPARGGNGRGREGLLGVRKVLGDQENTIYRKVG